MLNEWKFGLKQKFNVKCGIDLTLFIVFIALFINFTLKHEVAPQEAVTYLTIMVVLAIPTHIITKQWMSKAIRQSLTLQSDSLSETTTEIINTLNSQKKILSAIWTGVA